MDRARLKRWGKRAGLLLGGLLLLWAILLGAVFLWLGTESGRRTVLGFAESALADQGLYLSIDKTAGQLPFSIALHGVTVADEQGGWLNLEELVLELSPFSLFYLNLEIDAVKLTGVRVLRLPVMAVGNSADEPAKVRDDNIAIFLPINILLHKLVVDDSRLEPELIAGLVPERSEELLRLGPLDFSMNSSAIVKSGSILEPGHILAELNATVSRKGESELELGLGIGSHEKAAGNLRLKVLLQEAAGGLLASAANLPDLPSYRLEIASSSDLSELQFELRLEAEALASLSSTLKVVPLDAAMRPRRGGLDHFITPNWQADVFVRAEPGPLLSEQNSTFGVLPPEATDFLGAGLELHLLASSQVKDSGAEIEVKSFRLENELLGVGLEEAKAYMPFMDDGLLRFDFSGAVLAELKSEELFKRAGIVDEGIPLFGASTLRLESKALVEVNNSLPRVAFSLQGPLVAHSRHHVFKLPGGKPLVATLELGGVFADELKLDRLHIAGLGLELNGHSNLQFSPFKVELEADVSGERSGEWNDILYQLSSGIPPLSFKSAVQAKLDLNPQGDEPQLQASVNLAGADFGWVSEELAHVFGPYVSVLAEFSGPLMSPYNIELLGAATAFEPIEAAAYVPDVSAEALTDDVLGKASARARASMELSLFDVKPLQLMGAWTTAKQTEMLSLNGEADFIVRDGGLLLPENDDFAGSIEGRAGISGLVGGDDTVFHMYALLENPFAKSIISPLGDIGLRAAAASSLALRNGLEMEGDLSLEAENATTGPLALNSGWGVRIPEAGNLSVFARALDASFAGLTLTAEGELGLSSATDKPAIDADVAAHFDNWEALNLILERLELDVPPLTGSPIHIAMQLEPNLGLEQRQEARLDLSLERLHMLLPSVEPGDVPAVGKKQPPLGTSGLLIVNGIEVQASLDDLWGRGLLFAHIKSESGSLDVEKWGSAAVYLDLADNAGRINMAMRSDGDALRQVKEQAAGAPAFTKEMLDKFLGESTATAEFLPSFSSVAQNAEKTGAEAKKMTGLGDGELAALVGMFRLEPLTVRLDRAALYTGEFESGLYLQKPAFLRVGNESIRVEDLDFAILPGGYIKSDVYLSRDYSQAVTDIKDFPLVLLRKFANIPVPNGELSLLSHLEIGDGKLSSENELHAMLRPANVPNEMGAENASPVRVELKSALTRNDEECVFPVPPGGVRLVGSGSLLSLKTEESGGAGLHLNFDVPFHSSRQGLLVPDVHSPLEARVNWQGELAHLWALLPIADRYLNGMAQLELELNGNLAELQYQANAYLAGGRYEDRVLGFMLSGMQLEGKSDKNGSRILFSAKDELEGNMSFDINVAGTSSIRTGLGGGAGYSQPHLTARGLVQHLAPLHRDDVYLRLSGVVDASGPLFSPLVKGDFEVEEGMFNLLASMGGGVTLLPVEEKSDASAIKKPDPQSPILDINVNAPRRFFVRGAGMDSEWKASATVKGPATNPQYEAVISPVRGYFNLLSRPFAFSSGQINIWGSNDFFDSNLDLLLTHSNANLTAEVRAGGSFKRPTIKLSSTPAMPTDQIMAQILFGKDITQLSAMEALQVANGVVQLMSIGQGGTDLMGNVRDMLGVDTLRIGSSGATTRGGSISGSPDASAFGVGGGENEQDASSTTVEAGKYLSDTIYVGVEQGATENSTKVRVEVELRPNLTLQGSSGGESSQVGLGWKRDY